MGLIDKDKLLEGIKDKRYCSYCVYVGNNNRCFYPGDCNCSSVALIGALFQYINSLPNEEERIICEKKYSDKNLNPDYVAILQNAVNEWAKKDVDEIRSLMINAGILNEAGEPKEHIVDNE